MQEDFVGNYVFSEDELSKIYDFTGELLRSYDYGWGKPRSVWGSFFVLKTDNRNIRFVCFRGIIPIISLLLSSFPVLLNPDP